MSDWLEPDTIVISEVSLLSTRKKCYLPSHNSKQNNNSTTRLKGKYISYFWKVIQGNIANASIIKGTHA